MWDILQKKQEFLPVAAMDSLSKMSSAAADTCSFTSSFETLRQQKGVNIWKAIQIQLLVWNGAGLLPLFCLGLTFSTSCAAFSLGFVLGSIFALILCSPFLITTLQAIKVAREWWQKFSQNPTAWRSNFGKGWSALCDNLDDGMPTASPDRLCFCIGISQYANSHWKSLENGVRDAERVAKAFAAIGYTSHVVKNTVDVHDLNMKMDEFVRTRAAQDGTTGQTMVVVVYFAGHGVENSAGLINLCLSGAGSGNDGFVSTKKVTGDLVAKILNITGPSRKLACLALWDCCRLHQPELPVMAAGSGKRALGTKKHQLAEIRACLLGRFARDGVFADAFCHYLRQNEAYSVQELYEHVCMRVMQKTNNQQMCEMVCESSELSQRFDLFLTPNRWAEHCSKLEDLKSDSERSDPKESAFFTENLELREETQRLQMEVEQMEQMQVTLAEHEDRRSPDSLPHRCWRAIVQLCCLCLILWAFRMLWPTSTDDAVAKCMEELEKTQTHASIWYGVLACGIAVATVYAWKLRVKERKLTLENQVLTQEFQQLHADRDKLAQEVSGWKVSIKQIPPAVLHIVGQSFQWQNLEALLQKSHEVEALKKQIQYERSQRICAEQELESCKEELKERRRGHEHRRAAVKLHSPRILGGFTNCCLCGKRGIGTTDHWRSQENDFSSFCHRCIHDQ